MLAADVTDVRAVLPDFERAHGASPHDSHSRSRGHATHDESAAHSGERPISRVLQEVLDAVPTPRRSAEGMSVDDIAVRSGVSASQARTCLAQADEMGLVQQRGQDRWVYAPSDGAHPDARSSPCHHVCMADSDVARVAAGRGWLRRALA